MFEKIINNYINYLEKISDSRTRNYLINFFEKSVIQNIPPKVLLNLIDCINDDVNADIIKFGENNHILKQVQTDSKSHKAFLSIIKNYFGKDAYKLLKERKNLSIFNLKEVHVLHQEIFDNLGEKFVNNVLNYELDGALVTIPMLLSDKEEMKKFKFFHEFYTENIGSKPHHYNTLFLKYDKYKPLIKEITQKKLKLTNEQKEILKEIFRDEENSYSINSIDELNDYYKLKSNKYLLNKQRAFHYNDPRILKSTILSNFFGLKKSSYSNGYFAGDSKCISNILKFYDIDDILNKRQNIEGVEFSDEELEIIKDLKELDDANFEETLKIAEKYEKKGNKISSTVLGLIDKIPLTFTKNMLDSISRIDQLEEKCNRNEQGIKKGEAEGFPTYTLNGTDFAFLQTTNFIGDSGLSGNRLEGDLAESWFTFENGTSHISCSYINQDKQCSIEFADCHERKEKISYLFDDADIQTMGNDDIFTPFENRVANIYSDTRTTQFMYTDKLISKSGKSGGASFEYNEVAINRYNLNTNTIRFGGKIIPSAILANGQVNQKHIDAAKSFTDFLIKNGLKDPDYKMPIVVVDKQAYKAKKLLSFAQSLHTSQEETANNDIEKENINSAIKKENIINKSISKGVMK